MSLPQMVTAVVAGGVAGASVRASASSNPPRSWPLWPEEGERSARPWEPLHRTWVYGRGTPGFTGSWRDYLYRERPALEMCIECADALYAGCAPAECSLLDAAEGVRRVALLSRMQDALEDTFLSLLQCQELACELWKEAGIGFREQAPRSRAARWRLQRPPALAPLPMPNVTKVAQGASSLAGRLALNALGFTSKTLRLSAGASLHYFDIPGPLGCDAPPLVLIHGMCTHAQCMTALALLFHGTRRIIVPDLLDFDFGYSSTAAREARWADQPQAIAVLLASVNCGPADLVGHSFGGWVAQRVAYTHAHLVRRLVLLCPGGSGRYRVMASTAGALGPAVSLQRIVSRRYPTLGQAGAAVLASQIQHSFRSFNSMRFISRTSVAEYFGASMPVPHTTLLLWGTEDFVQFPLSAATMLRELPNGAGVWMHGADHFCVVTSAVTIHAVSAPFLAADTDHDALRGVAGCGTGMHTHPVPRGGAFGSYGQAADPSELVFKDQTTGSSRLSSLTRALLQRSTGQVVPVSLMIRDSAYIPPSLCDPAQAVRQPGDGEGKDSLLRARL